VAAVQQEGDSVAAVAAAFRVSTTTVRRWMRRATSETDLQDRSSRPRRLARQHARPIRRRVLRLRRRRWSSLQIARAVGLPVATVVTMQRRLGLARLPRLHPPEPVIRYERAAPGDLLHVDVKKLGRIGGIGHRIHHDYTTRWRGIGWEYVHVAIDDHTRLAYVERLATERGPATAAFLRRATRWFARCGIPVRAVLSDNGKNYTSHAVRDELHALGIRHLRTRPYRPQTNGKAERFIRTLLTEWAYARAYRTSATRVAALRPYLRYYNTERPHGALGFVPPQHRLVAAK
jgi:transposase InsO family protein